MRCATRTTASQAHVQWTTSFVDTTSPFFGRCYIWLSEVPTVTGFNFFRAATPANSTLVRIAVSTGVAADLHVLNAAGQTIGDGTYGLSTSTLYRVEFKYTPGTTTGQVHVKIFEGHTTTLLEEFGEGVNGDTGAEVGAIRWGASQSDANTPTSTGYVWMSHLVVDATDWPGSAIPQTGSANVTIR